MTTLGWYLRLSIWLFGIFLGGHACATPIVDIDPKAYFTVREYPDGTRKLDQGNVPGFRGFISNVSLFTDKTFMEYGLAALPADFERASLIFKTSGGTNITRTVNIGWYEADGVASVDDFDVVPVMVASFTQSAGISELFEIDVTAAVRSALPLVDTVGFVFAMETAGAQTFLSSSPVSLRVVPAPSTVGLLIVGCMGLIAGRQISRSSGPVPEAI